MTESTLNAMLVVSNGYLLALLCWALVVNRRLSRQTRPPQPRALTSVTPGQVPDATIDLHHLTPDVQALLGGGGDLVDTHYKVIQHPLTLFEVTQRGFALPDMPADMATMVLTVLGGTVQRQDVDYKVLSINDVAFITWDNAVYGTLTDDLRTTMNEGDCLQVMYRI